MDLSLSARQAGMAVIYSKNDLFVHYKPSFYLGIDNEPWQGRLGFFVKWLGKLPKNDNYVEFAQTLMAI